MASNWLHYKFIIRQLPRRRHDQLPKAIAWLAASNSARYWLDVYGLTWKIGFDPIATELPYTALTACAVERIFSRNYMKLLRRYGRYVCYVRVETRHKLSSLCRPQHHGSTPKGTHLNFSPNRSGVEKNVDFWPLSLKRCNLSYY